MESDLHRHPPMFLDHHPHHHHNQQMNSNNSSSNNNSSSGLTRFRSAPSSYFSSIIDKEFYESIFNKPSSPETEKILARFMNSLANDEPEDQDSLLAVPATTTTTTTTTTNNHNININNNNKNMSPSPQPPQEVVQQISQVKQEEISVSVDNTNNTLQPQPQPLPSSMNNESLVQQNQQQQMNSFSNNYGSLSGNPPFYQSSGRPPLPNQMKTGRGNASNLIRHGSSPAGLFSNLNIEGYAAALRGMGTMGAAATNTSEDASFSPSAARLKNPSPFTSSGMMTPIAEIRNTSNTLNNPDTPEAFAESQDSDFISGLPSWDDSSSSMMSDNIAGQKRFRDDDVKPFAGVNAADTQVKTEAGQAPAAPLAHQLSMPNTPSELAAIEKFLQCSDSVVCKIRAKRGCATHPRSIAERVRRTKISERMRKLQDLVPNMDKQTNTADMLDLAVEYIKELQNQVEVLINSHISKINFDFMFHMAGRSPDKRGGLLNT